MKQKQGLKSFTQTQIKDLRQQQPLESPSTVYLQKQSTRMDLTTRQLSPTKMLDWGSPGKVMPKRTIKTSALSAAISALTYGLSCLIFQSQQMKLYECLLMIHEQYINILHLIINRSTSYLLKLHDVKQISSEDTFISSKLALIKQVTLDMRDNYIALNLKSLKSVVLLFRTDNEKDAILKGLKFFLNEARVFYDKQSRYDPFKAESMMLFLEADKDGGNLLDIEEIVNILTQLKINKEKLDIQADVLEINKSLYERQNMRRPKNASSLQLTPIAFEYLLRYYSMKQQLSQHFKHYCPMFKPRTKNHKNTIIDIVKNNQKPIMSSNQLQEFYREKLMEQKSLDELQEIIRKFPVYDGQGKEKFDVGEEALLNFDNFCNLICGKENSIIQWRQATQPQNNLNMTQPIIQNPTSNTKVQRKQTLQSCTNDKAYLQHTILDYYIYTDQSFHNPKRKEQSNYFTLALKRGVKCLFLPLNISVHHKSKPTTKKSQSKQLSALVVRIDQKQKEELLLDDILKDVKTYAFERNKLPFWIVFDIYSIVTLPNLYDYLDLLAQVVDDTFEKQSIFMHEGTKQQKKLILPTPLQLQNKIILLSNFNPKLIPKTSSIKNQNIEIPPNLMKRLSFQAVKLDFERKGQTCWNICFINQDMLKSYESAEQQNISNYSKKLLQFCTTQGLQSADPQISFRQGIHFQGQNFEKNKEYNYLLHSRFAQVPQQCFGYLLKPFYMLTQNPAPLYTNKNFTKQSTTKIKFNVLSGQKIILNNLAYQQFYVEVGVKGNIPEEQANKLYKSEKRTQGFYTVIGLECEFVLFNEQFFTIFIAVKSAQNHKILSARAVSLKNMREGLRTLQLFDQRMQTKQNSYLLIHYTRKQIYQRDQKVNKMQQFLK